MYLYHNFCNLSQCLYHTTILRKNKTRNFPVIFEEYVCIYHTMVKLYPSCNPPCYYFISTKEYRIHVKKPIMLFLFWYLSQFIFLWSHFQIVHWFKHQLPQWETWERLAVSDTQAKNNLKAEVCGGNDKPTNKSTTNCTSSSYTYLIWFGKFHLTAEPSLRC